MRRCAVWVRRWLPRPCPRFSKSRQIPTRLIIAKDYADVSRKAANIIAAQIQLKPDCVLGLATGSSPVGTYKELIAKCESGDLDFYRSEP